jgi:hypothetical protein
MDWDEFFKLRDAEPPPLPPAPPPAIDLSNEQVYVYIYILGGCMYVCETKRPRVVTGAYGVLAMCRIS